MRDFKILDAMTRNNKSEFPTPPLKSWSKKRVEMRTTGLEPVRLSSADLKSAALTNSATCAYFFVEEKAQIIISKFHVTFKPIVTATCSEASIGFVMSESCIVST